MAADDSWIRAEMGGTTRASLISRPEVLAALIKRAKRPLFIVGNGGARGPEGEVVTGLIRRVSSLRGGTIVTTSSAVRELTSRGIGVNAVMGGMEIADRLRDPSWRGFDGEGKYDLIFITGILYPMAWVIFSGIRNGVPGLKTVSLDRGYQPHASWSYGNAGFDQWKEQLEGVVSLLEDG